MKEKLVLEYGKSVEKRKSKHFLKRMLAVVLIATILLMSACNGKAGDENSGINTLVEVDDGVALPQFEQEVLLCSEQAKQVYDGELKIAKAVATGTPYRPFVFEYRLEHASGTLRLSEDSAFADAQEYTLDREKTSVTIDNLKTGTTYYYQVEVSGKQYTGTFRTASSNRFISIPGVENLRDIGGYKTLDGKTIKQGLLIRGCELDGIKNEEYFVDDQYISSVQETFGFVYDLDLRSPEIIEGDYQSRLGAEVGHKFYDAPTYAQIFRSEYLNSMREIFADLADPDKYPMYLHCTWGRDRTGTIVLLLQGLLNVSKEDLMQEYRLTGYVTPSVATNNKMDVVFMQLESYEGDTLQEKIINYLTTTVGVTQEEISSIQSIFLE
jgi:protein-tyrosine phosphatase